MVAAQIILFLIPVVTVVQTMTYYHQARLVFQHPGTYRDCDVCSTMLIKTKVRKTESLSTCSRSQVCRAVGTAGKPAGAECIEAASLSPAFGTPICARGSGDTAVHRDGTMITCSEDEDCPRDFACTSGACCRDITKCQKIGNCPASVTMCGFDNDCSSDSDCPGDAKCCSYPTCDGSRCIMPFFTGK